MVKMICVKCDKEVMMRDMDGVCPKCLAEVDESTITQIRLPNGFVADWIDTISFISKKKNHTYFNIPIEQRVKFLPDTKYHIIIREVK